MEYRRYVPYDSDHFHHVRDSETDMLISHYPKSNWGAAAAESECRRRNRENFDVLTAVSGPGDPTEFLTKLWYDEDGFRRR